MVEELGQQIISFVLGLCTVLLTGACGYLLAEVKALTNKVNEVRTSQAVAAEAAKQFVEKEEIHEIKMSIGELRAKVEPFAEALPDMLRLMGQMLALVQRRQAAA